MFLKSVLKKPLDVTKCPNAQIHITIVERYGERVENKRHRQHIILRAMVSEISFAAGIWRVQRRNSPQFAKGTKGQHIRVDADKLLRPNFKAHNVERLVARGVPAVLTAIHNAVLQVNVLNGLFLFVGKFGRHRVATDKLLVRR